MSKKKGMKKNEKIVILVLVIILIAVIIFAVTRNSTSEAEEKTATSSTTESSETEEDDDEEEDGEYVTTLEDGTKLNTSTKLNEDKTLDEIEITDIQLTESEGVTQILATMTNTSDEVQGGYIATLTLLDADGNTLVVLSPYIPEIEPGESSTLNASAVFDYSDAYDFTITK